MRRGFPPPLGGGFLASVVPVQPLGMVVTTQKTSAFVFTSGYSTQITSSASAPSGDGAASVSVNGVSLEAKYHLETGGLRVLVRGSDSADPSGTRLHETLLLMPGDRRVISVRRAHTQQLVHFTITRIGDGLEIFSDGT